MKQMKRLLSLVLTVVMIVVLVPTSANAASTFDQRVSDLRKKFPNNAYWNHAVYNDSQRADVLLANWDNSYGDYTTSTPCATHNGQPGYGQCDCNVFDGGMQCWGFANRIFYGIFGVYASNVSQRWDTQNVQKGDWIRLENENHSAVVLSRNGDYLTIVEGNRDGNWIVADNFRDSFKSNRSRSISIEINGGVSDVVKGAKEGLVGATTAYLKVIPYFFVIRDIRLEMGIKLPKHRFSVDKTAFDCMFLFNIHIIFSCQGVRPAVAPYS